ncbi:hypothetical protein HGRIS_008694 [Hohenbuehelia grisea]|uniref:F-box domain-containing protein n=1 Tax=Hohenbuehelia grisea TaxID=104357 RepID=A0ABR3J929_9AGAR
MTQEDSHDGSRATKRIKITANNGYHIAARYHTYATAAKRVVRSDSSGHLGGTRRRAKLSCLPELPWDALLEIFGHLAPLDVLHLARTSKALRRVLMSKSSTSVWLCSFAAVPDVPPCPPDMTLPSYANLLFDTHCHVCLQRNIRNVDYFLRVRLCKKCTKTNLSSIVHYKDQTPLNDAIKHSIPFSEWYLDKPTVCFVPAKNKFTEVYSKAEGDTTALLDQCKADTDKRWEHASKCITWAKSLAQARDDELAIVRACRAVGILEKLSDLGWEEEIAKMPTSWSDDAILGANITPFDQHPLVRVSRPLTDRAWANIKREMEIYMGTLKTFRLNQERQNLLRQRRDIAVTCWRKAFLPGLTDALRPGVVDFWKWHEVHRIIELPNEIQVTRDSFKAINKYNVSEFAQDWREQKLSSFLRGDQHSQSDNLYDFVSRFFYRSYYGEVQMQRFKLAACVVTCQNPDFIHERQLTYPSLKTRYHCMWYPEFLRHACNTVVSGRRKNRETDIDDHVPLSPWMYSRSSYLSQAEWSSDGLVVDRKASNVVSNILEAVGLNPESTVTTIDELDPRLVCLKCSYGERCNGERDFIVRSWRESVQHCMTTHFGDASVEWEEISDEDTIKAREAEKAALDKRTHWSTPLWRCLRCMHTERDPGRMNREQLDAHFMNRHNASTHDEPVKHGQDYREAWDAPPSFLPSTRMAPQTAVKRQRWHSPLQSLYYTGWRGI